ncbi:hypothetical protein PUH89_18315 [Rhodobacter capsulatus]|uniref:hypothetical protein n=1 Tax=Rhodobacter capsulatus TaxID=1061 RepID=UPI00111386FF|nr:hypothetical protein [Rhodobacter capsulatus]WER09229.1 hypothetical protein PUH89_18315 [Rhodobacter capsulatus]
MTAQMPEKIVYQGAILELCTEPLEDYFAKGGIRPALERSTTALWRRYVGSWEVVDNLLYLTHLDGRLVDGTKITVSMIFPGFPEKVTVRADRSAEVGA